MLVGIAASALALPTWIVATAPAVPASHVFADVKRPQRVLAATELPEVEPLQIQDLDPEEAREFNASIPFVKGPNPAARPFRFAGDEAALSRATDCLAAAAYYEAGDDAVGQKAVVQVVLNRLRHPAFPKTVCGVVFQGAERSTGCQFTFTCDGALARQPSEAAWTRARQVATMALKGAVYRPVGYATHYHTDWVVPYWSASLDKIAEVHTHLFFRWTGWWGTPPAFRRAVSGDEPAIAKLAQVSAVHRLGGVLEEAEAAVATAAPYLGAVPDPLTEAPDTYHVVLAGMPPEAFRAFADAACGPRERCKFMGWADKKLVPAGVTVTPEQMGAMSFSYLRDKSQGFDRALWNCQQFPRLDKAQCMKRQAMMAMMPVAAPTPASSPTPAKGPAELDGVRRKDAVVAPAVVKTAPGA